MAKIYYPCDFLTKYAEELLERYKEGERLFDIAFFKGMNLSNMHLQKAIFIASDFTDAFLENTDLKHTDFSDANFESAILKNADLRFSNLFDAHLENADLTNADLTKTNMENAICSHTKFIDAKLIGANLKNSYIYKADFRNSDLTGANFEGAYLYGVNFENAKLKDANWKDAKIKETEKTIYSMLRTEHTEQKESYKSDVYNSTSKVLLPKNSLANILRHPLQSMPQSTNNLIMGKSRIKFSNGEIEIRIGSKEKTLYKHFNPKNFNDYLVFSQRYARNKLNKKPAK